MMERPVTLEKFVAIERGFYLKLHAQCQLAQYRHFTSNPRFKFEGVGVASTVPIGLLRSTTAWCWPERARLHEAIKRASGCFSFVLKNPSCVSVWAMSLVPPRAEPMWCGVRVWGSPERGLVERRSGQR
jgi:hypothetical protein